MRVGAVGAMGCSKAQSVLLRRIKNDLFQELF